MEVGVFVPIGNNGWLISTTSPQYKPSFELNKTITQSADKYGFDFALSMIKLREASRLTAMAFTWARSSSSSRSIGGSWPLGAASAASEAICAAASRSISHCRRKLDTEGTNTSTSASMTKRMVSKSSLADSPGTKRNIGCFSGFMFGASSFTKTLEPKRGGRSRARPILGGAGNQ